MSKRHGDVRVSDFIVSAFLNILFNFIDSLINQEKGWEPDAVVNWLAIAGWGRQQMPFSAKDSASEKPKSDILTMNELIQEVWFESIFA